jgi:hypothetical protein
LQVGFFGGFRPPRAGGHRVAHLRWTQEGIEIVLPRSKTD